MTTPQKIDEAIEDARGKMSDREKIARLRVAMTHIEILSKPGQAVSVGDAVDIICDIWNEAKDTLKATE